MFLPSTTAFHFFKFGIKPAGSDVIGIFASATRHRPSRACRAWRKTNSATRGVHRFCLAL